MAGDINKMHKKSANCKHNFMILNHLIRPWKQDINSGPIYIHLYIVLKQYDIVYLLSFIQERNHREQICKELIWRAWCYNGLLQFEFDHCGDWWQRKSSKLYFKA